MMRKKRKPKKRIGTSALVPVLLLAAVLPLASASKKKAGSDTYAVVSGSVFDSSGYALPDADVTLAPENAASSVTGAPKAKPLQAVSDARGEFIFRVPPGPAHYVLTVAAKGRQSRQKTVSVENQERIEVTFQLEAESK